MVFKGTWLKKFKNCVYKFKLDVNMKNKIGKGGLAPAGKCFLRSKKKNLEKIIGKEYILKSAVCNIKNIKGNKLKRVVIS